ncbi:MAG: hypothetical protein ABIQ07_09710 [Ginsengibacter sp.]
MLSHKSRLINFLVLIISFQVLNMSIDSPNARRDSYYKAPDNFNYIDTYVEYISEVLCKRENAIPEPGKRHQKQWHHKLQQVICDNLYTNKVVISSQVLRNTFFNLHDKYAYQFSKEITPPPKPSC